MEQKQGSLVIAGTGIKYGSHLTAEAEAYIRQCDKLFYVIPGPEADQWMQSLNKTAESLGQFYAPDKRRLDTYQQMVERIMDVLRQGKHVCAIFYGHPGVFVLPSHEAIKQAKNEGYLAWMAPGVSAEDCLFADLSIDPATHGCQTFETTDFLIRQRRFDPTCHLVLWQVGMIGNMGKSVKKNNRGIKLLVKTLHPHYSATHQVAVYHAAQYPNGDPDIQWVTLAQLPKARFHTISTLYVPPIAQAPIYPEILAELGLTNHDLQKKW